MSNLPADCLNEIFIYLEDKDTLRSCLLVNRLWCQVSVRILWTSIQNYNTLITCLPMESKEILCKNKITISNSTSKPPLFNYVAFIKCLSINEIFNNILRKSITSQGFDDVKYKIVTQEIFKMFMNQISLKKLDCYSHPSIDTISNIPFTTYPGAIDSLKNLSELICDSDYSSELFYQISQISFNIR